MDSASSEIRKAVASLRGDETYKPEDIQALLNDKGVGGLNMDTMGARPISDCPCPMCACGDEDQQRNSIDRAKNSISGDVLIW